MRCERCNALLTDRIYNINGQTLCESCARLLQQEDPFRDFGAIFGGAFPLLDNLAGALIGGAGDLEFSNTKLRCPRCGSSLSDIERVNGRLGCIECYNTFGDIVYKRLLRLQGTTDYVGRTPGTLAEGITDDKKTGDAGEIKDKPQKTEKAASKGENAEDKAGASAASEEEKSLSHEEILEQIRNSDLSMIPDDDIKEAMDKAVEAEDYILAAKLRDELGRRTGGN